MVGDFLYQNILFWNSASTSMFTLGKVANSFSHSGDASRTREFETLEGSDLLLLTLEATDTDNPLEIFDVQPKAKTRRSGIDKGLNLTGKKKENIDRMTLYLLISVVSLFVSFLSLVDGYPIPSFDHNWHNCSAESMALGGQRLQKIVNSGIWVRVCPKLL